MGFNKILFSSNNVHISGTKITEMVTGRNKRRG